MITGGTAGLKASLFLVHSCNTSRQRSFPKLFQAQKWEVNTGTDPTKYLDFSPRELQRHHFSQYLRQGNVPRETDSDVVKHTLDMH